MSLLSKKSDKDENALSMLAAAVNAESQMLVEVKCIQIATFSIEGIPFEIFVFPSGEYYSLEQLSKALLLDFKTIIAKIMDEEPPKSSRGILQDVASKSLYISIAALKKNSDKLESKELTILSNLTLDGLSNETQNLEGLERFESSPLEDSTMKIVVTAYIPPEKRPYLKRHSAYSNELGRKAKSGRLSIDTKVANEEFFLNQQMKLKLKQQAIITARTKSANPDNEPAGLGQPSTTRHLASIDNLISPKTQEFHSKELPKLKIYNEPLSAGLYGPSHKSNLSPHSMQISSKSQFLALCEHFYDLQEDNSRLQAQLKEQLKQSTALLMTLSSSGQMIEQLAKSHFADAQKLANEALLEKISVLTGRVASLEKAHRED